MTSPTSSSSLSSLSSARHRTSGLGVSLGSSSSLNNLLKSSSASSLSLTESEEWLRDFLMRFRHVFAPKPMADSISAEIAPENQENDTQEECTDNKQIVCQFYQERIVIRQEIVEEFNNLENQGLLHDEPTAEKSLGCCAVFQWLFGKYFRGY